MSASDYIAVIKNKDKFIIKHQGFEAKVPYSETTVDTWEQMWKVTKKLQEEENPEYGINFYGN